MGITATSLAAQSLTEKIDSKNEKGSIGNRIEHGAKQYLNLRKTIIKDEFALAGGIAATAGATALTAKSKTVQSFLSKGAKAISNKLKCSDTIKDIASEVTPYLKKGAEMFKALPTPAKAVLGAGLVLTSIVANQVHAKGIYEAGKIDQEYTDKAKLQKTLG